MQLVQDARQTDLEAAAQAGGALDTGRTSATDAEMIRILDTACAQAGSARRWAMQRGLTPSLVSMTLRGERAVGEEIANALGFVRPAFWIRRRG